MKLMACHARDRKGYFWYVRGPKGHLAIWSGMRLTSYSEALELIDYLEKTPRPQLGKWAKRLPR
jgi:hypothetical protein